jgi:hypothetical protein
MTSPGLPSSAAASGHPDRPIPLLTLWRRYWLFGWLFERCDLGDPFRDRAALARNRARARLLPVYLRRYAITGTLALLLAALAGPAGPMPLQAGAAVVVAACLVGLVVGSAIWLALRMPSR